ncbi:energy transducer TonB [Flavobacterium sp. P4023]|uniref:Energy transducer TonB n=1 Tax=Flavobacterium flabelliforme TaxID=2816119 RepID=A0ABS5CP22_9FLAO|nr:energy transducer TonB [Flavobacterium flabelliforme]MBP4140367.1 energy transducer TonB [Flavobacterium flabelliforme]
MSKLSIYETSWLNLVFENRNKEYGAYQLRKESNKTLLFALFMGVLFLFGTISIPRFLNYFSADSSENVSTPDFTNTIVQINEIIPNQVKPNESVPAVKSNTTEAPIIKKQLVNPEIVQAAQATQDVPKNTDNQSTTTVVNDGTGITGVNPTAGTTSGTDNTNGTDLGNTIVASVALDKLPEFPGGINKFYVYVGNNFEKPEIENTSNIRIFVSFVIEKDGSMTDIQVKKDPGYGLGKEAIRVLKSLRTKWTPGMIDGKAVRTAYNLPIIIKME